MAAERFGISVTPTERILARRFKNITNESDRYTLIWLDKNVNASEENIRTQSSLRPILSHLITFEDISAWMSSSIDLTTRKVILLVSESYSHQALPSLHIFPQVKAIYIYSSVETPAAWAKKYGKVSCVIELATCKHLLHYSSKVSSANLVI
jgi:hypothetical protein